MIGGWRSDREPPGAPVPPTVRPRRCDWISREGGPTFRRSPPGKVVSWSPAPFSSSPAPRFASAGVASGWCPRISTTSSRSPTRRDWSATGVSSCSRPDCGCCRWAGVLSPPDLTPLPALVSAAPARSTWHWLPRCRGARREPRSRGCGREGLPPRGGGGRHPWGTPGSVRLVAWWIPSSGFPGPRGRGAAVEAGSGIRGRSGPAHGPVLHQRLPFFRSHHRPGNAGLRAGRGKVARALHGLRDVAEAMAAALVPRTSARIGRAPQSELGSPAGSGSPHVHRRYGSARAGGHRRRCARRQGRRVRARGAACFFSDPTTRSR